MLIHPRFSARLLLVGFIAALGLASMQAQSVESSPAVAPIHQRLPKRLVADYTNGGKYLNPPYDVAQIPFHKLTHINHAGVPWEPDGRLQVPYGFVEPDLIAKAHAAGVQDLLEAMYRATIGGK